MLDYECKHVVAKPLLIQGKWAKVEKIVDAKGGMMGHILSAVVRYELGKKRPDHERGPTATISIQEAISGIESLKKVAPRLVGKRIIMHFLQDDNVKAPYHGRWFYTLLSSTRVIPSVYHPFTAAATHTPSPTPIAGTVAELDITQEDLYRVQYDDGDEEWIAYRMVRSCLPASQHT